mmetsp:Transcript_19614/g.30226  ORF Transcript_19614/g.30226 Transcript_19614/m.30226 type:complete len:93 (-) Transcript_19614:3533-3811(-)
MSFFFSNCGLKNLSYFSGLSNLNILNNLNFLSLISHRNLSSLFISNHCWFPQLIVTTFYLLLFDLLLYLSGFNLDLDIACNSLGALLGRHLV